MSFFFGGWGGGFSYTSHAGFIFILGVSLTHPVLVSHLSGEFSYTSHTGFPFLWGVSLTLPVLLRFVLVCFFVFVLSGEFLSILILIFLFLNRCSFPYTSRAGFIFMWEVSLTHPVLALFLSGEFLLHIPCWVHCYRGTCSYTSRASFTFIWGVSLTHPMLALLFCRGFLLYIPSCLPPPPPPLNLRSFSYTSGTGFIFFFLGGGGVLLNIPCWLYFYVGSFFYTSHADFYTSRVTFIFIWEVSLTHPCWFFWIFFPPSGEILLHIPCWFRFYLGSFSYTSHDGFVFIWVVPLNTSHAGFTFIWGVSLTHPMLVSHSCGEFLLHIPCCIDFYARSFSYTSRTAFVFVSLFFLTHPMLAFLYCGEFLLHIPCWLHFYLGSFS